MKCLNCGTVFQGRKTCPECGVDAYLYMKTKNASIRLYNNALAQISRRDISGARFSLIESVIFDKYNYKARNLLGLVYFEKGQVADALKQWIISSSYFKDNNPAASYIDMLQNKARQMDMQNDAVRLYNQSSRYLEQGNEDLAIIQLKKAVDLSPGLLEAHNMLALCYMNRKQFDAAKKHIDDVLRVDAFNPTAIRYADFIKSLRSRRSSSINSGNGAEKKKGDKFFYKNYGDIKSIIRGSEIIAFVIGLAVTSAVFASLIFPALSETKDRTIEQLTAQIYALGGEAPIDNLPAPDENSEISRLREENKRLAEEIENYKSTASVQERLITLQEAVTMAANGSYEEAALSIVSLDTTGFSDEDLARYNTLRETAFQQAAEGLFEKGKNEFLNNNYEQARVYLENTLSVVSGGDFQDDAIYYLGKIAESEGDVVAAREYYERIVNEFPDSNQLRNAQNSLEGLE